ncbi:hypothetical protein GGX14DRAFT_378289 [Mycena pura]|uniref:HAT C-terminal dimerisation domain-containing protein n=1 Tax=Mycena pura TaxID=153505 RepID=A0AAD6UX33_9AGAR|nr:hypothetical protein GGX14DRAFT_378289 [Mycena pura]
MAASNRIARDYLSIARTCLFVESDYINGCTATSVYVERQFSRGRLLISSVRNRLSGDTIRELMCLGCWSLLGYIEDEDIEAVTQDVDSDPE